MALRASRRSCIAVLAVTALLSSGCGQLVSGNGRPAEGIRPNVAPANFEIVGATDSETDTLARNALADLNTFWEQSFPDVFGTDFTPLTGGYYSVDPANFQPQDYPNDIGCFSGPDDVANNAFYCFDGDDIVYDRTFIGQLAQQYGRFIPALVMAHEFGHAVQARQPPPSNLSIVYETQADCYAGAWSAWVAADKAKHFLIRPSELDDVIRGYLLLRDEPGSGPTQRGAHGSYFDRVSAFQEGFDSGAKSCATDFDNQRVFTQTAFTDASDFNQGGNSDYPTSLQISEDTLNAFWSNAFSQVFNDQWTDPTLQPFNGNRPLCDGKQQRRDLTYCQPENEIDFDNTTLMPTVHDKIGDFAVSTLLSTQYALAARAQHDLDYRGEDALRSSICLTGWYTKAFFDGDINAQATISPGDVDEAIQTLLEYGNQENVLPDVGLSGFQQVDLFRQGFLQGASACEVGVSP